MCAADLLEVPQKSVQVFSCGDLEVSILVVVLETPNLSVGMKEATDLELGRGYLGTSLGEL